jgi:hypothetical protein
VLDDPGGRPAAVPHQFIEMGHMHQQHVRVVHQMLCIGRIFAGRIVLQVQSRQVSLLIGQDLELVLTIILTRLKQDAIQLQILHLPGRDFMHIVRPGKTSRSPAVTLRPPWFHG